MFVQLIAVPQMNPFIMAVMTSMLLSLCESPSFHPNFTVAATTICPKRNRTSFVLDIVGVDFPVTAYSLFRPFSQMFSCSVSLFPTHSHFASPPSPPLFLSPLPPFPLPALPERGWPLGLASLSVCHVCNLNCGRAKQGRATSKAFHKTRVSLWNLSGSCSVRNEMGLHIFYFFSSVSFQQDYPYVHLVFLYLYITLSTLCSHLLSFPALFFHFPFLSLPLCCPPRFTFTLCVRFALTSHFCCCKTLSWPLSYKHRLLLQPNLMSLTGGSLK